MTDQSAVAREIAASIGELELNHPSYRARLQTRIAEALARARQEGAEEMRRRAVAAVEEYAREREEDAPSEDSADYAERSMVYAKHVRRAAARIGALSAQPEEG
jgi:acyl-CoA hydrolase